MSVAVQSTAWLRCYEPRPDASGRIVCFGPAGGAASFFRGWSRHAPADVEVWALAYPGRERRIDEPPLERMEDLADAITGVLAPRIDRPTVLFGHSMGASVAYEVTRRLEARDGPAPAGLVVSARRGPCHQRACPDDTAGLTDAEILGRLRALGGTAAEVLDDPAMHELIVPPCRTDFELLGHYRPQPAPPIGTPLAVVHGDRDPAVPAAEVRSWTQASRHAAGTHVFPGEHFFCVHHEAALVAYVAALLRGEPGAEPAIVKPRRFVRRPAGEPAPAPAYHERRVAFDGDPLAAAVALAESSTLPNVLYERRGTVSWAEGTRVETELAGDDPPLQHTRAMLAQLELTGWRAYGWAGFDLAHALHGTGDVPAGTPLVRLLIPDREVRLGDGTALLRARDPGDLARLAERLSGLAAGAPPANLARPASARPAPSLRSDAAGDYLAAVGAAVADIRAHRLEKVILSRVVEVTEPIDLAASYLTGRRANDPARSFLLSLGDLRAAGFSPEIVVRVTADGLVTTQPLAGTRALQGDDLGDCARRDELEHDTKEVFEHAISVRLAAGELAAVCAPSSVRIEQFMEVEERGSVQHLASRLTGRLARPHTGWDAFAALFPAVTASGIPKAAACALIAELEPEPRGIYSGAVLAVDADGTIDAALVLRTIFQQDGRTWLRAGAGIVADSSPERELEETHEKLRSVAPHLVRRATTNGHGLSTGGGPARPAADVRRPDVEVLGIGFGPANLALAIALREEGGPAARFVERQPQFGWHRGMLLDDATMQVSFLKDLATMRNPVSDFSFVTYLHEQGRLVDFINHKTLFPLRIEFHAYLSWAAARFPEEVDYGHEVVDVRPLRDGDDVDAFDVVAAGADGARSVTRTRDVVVAAGLEPMLPAGIEPGERIWHTAQLLPGAERMRASGARARRFVVVGAGQSAAEAVAYLHREFDQTEVCSVFARYGYSPADDSPFANRIFDPAAAELFHGAPEGLKAMLMAYHRNTNYSVVDGELIEQLYREHYRERVIGRERLRMLNTSAVHSCVPARDGVDVVIESLAGGDRETLRADAVIFATGYRSRDTLATLGAAGALCARDPRGLPLVRRDHSIELTVPARASVYVQGATEHAFGLTSTLLSMTAVRAGEIAAAIAAARVREPAAAPS